MLLPTACSAPAATAPRADAAVDGPVDGSAAADVATDDGIPADAGPVGDAGPAELHRRIVRTTLAFDLTAHTGHARIDLAAADAPGVTFEVGELAIGAVRDGSGTTLTTSQDGALLHVDAPAAAATVDVTYGYRQHDPADFQGVNAAYTLTWPYYCGNVFPCHSDPAGGTTFALSLTGVPTGQTAVFPTMIPADAPAYQLAWAVGTYETVDLGATPGGTHLVVHAFPADVAAARTATAHLVDGFAWYERTLGSYAFGSEAGSVEAAWGPGAYGGMEHHPLWHVGASAIGDELTHLHEAAHGWFGDGIRVACWEDFVLSEGTVNYLAARATGVVSGAAAETAVWTRYDRSAGAFGLVAWPSGCHTVDVLRDHLFSQAPYVRGAHFHRALEHRLGTDAYDAILRRFYAEHRTQAARLTDLLGLVRTVSGYDPTDCAVSWLRPTRTADRGPDPCE